MVSSADGVRPAERGHVHVLLSAFVVMSVAQTQSGNVTLRGIMLSPGCVPAHCEAATAKHHGQMRRRRASRLAWPLELNH